MEYIERTQEVLRHLKGDPSLLNRVANIITLHHLDGEEELADIPHWHGNSRTAYEVGTLALPDKGNLVLILKLFKKRGHSSWTWPAISGEDKEYRIDAVKDEMGAFETYYSFIAGLTEEVGYGSEQRYERFKRDCQKRGNWTALRNSSYRFRLDGPSWSGTRVSVGDLGAVPYFQMVVHLGEWFGWLTEGLPPIIEPKWSANSGRDDFTVESGRIMDLSPHQNILSSLNSPSGFWRGSPDYLGLIKRGQKYFAEPNVLTLP